MLELKWNHLVKGAPGEILCHLTIVHKIYIEYRHGEY